MSTPYLCQVCTLESNLQEIGRAVDFDLLSSIQCLALHEIDFLYDFSAGVDLKKGGWPLRLCPKKAEPFLHHALHQFLGCYMATRPRRASCPRL